MSGLLSGFRRPLGISAVAGGVALGACFLFAPPAIPEDKGAISAFPVAGYQGSKSCATSGCHGGGEGRDEYSVFMKKDVHRRFVSTLTRKGFLKADTTLDNPDCTQCHAPMAPLIPLHDGKLSNAMFLDGFSCETCHGKADKWIRSHTRYDYSHEQRVAAGLRDLSTAYAQANTCVACHQFIRGQLLENGHPELYFDLDGQITREPPHWPVKPGSGPSKWLTGQAVALREMSWHLGKGEEVDRTRWDSMIWMLNLVPLPGTGSTALTGSSSDFSAVQSRADALAKKASGQEWAKSDIVAALKKLTATADQFTDAKTPLDVQIRRAQDLTIAVERLSAALGETKFNADVIAMGDQIRVGKRHKSMKQMRGQFKPKEYAAALGRINSAL